MSKPVVFLAFANSETAPLPSLTSERREVYNALFPLKEEEEIDLIHDDSASSQVIINEVDRHGEDIFIFHYGGHANKEQMEFEGGGGYVQGLSRLLGGLKNIKLVFINGCSSKDQADFYLQEGIQAVIATSFDIEDSMAKDFAKVFYKSLQKDKTLKNAYEAAVSTITMLHDIESKDEIKPITRGLKLKREEEEDGIPWRLYVLKERADKVLNWRMSDSFVGNKLEVLKKKVKELIIGSFFEDAFDELNRYLEDKEDSRSKRLKDDIILLYGRYNRTKRDHSRGLITQERAAVQYAGLTNSLLSLLDDLK